MDILIHPVYFGSVEYYAFLAKAKKIYFEINDHYQKQTYRNRTYIATANGKHLLNVPIKHIGIKNVNTHQLFKEVKISYESDWRKTHWKSIQIAYQTSPFFEYYEDDLAPVFEKKHSFLTDLNLHAIEVVHSLLGLDFNPIFTEKFEATPEDKTDVRFLSVAKRATDLHYPPYTQVLQKHHGFLENLSVLDLLFNEGPGSLEYLEKIEI